MTFDLLIAGTRGRRDGRLTIKESLSGPDRNGEAGPGRVGTGGGVERCSSVAGCLLGVLSV